MNTQSVPVTKKRPILLIVVVVLFGICVFCIATTTVMDKLGLIPTSTASPLPSATLPPTQTPLPAATLPSSATALPTGTLTPEAQLRALIETALGRGNRDVPRLANIQWNAGTKELLIQWAINDNLTGNLIMVGIQNDITDTLKAIAQSSLPFDYQRITFDGTFPLQDVYGNVVEERVVEVSYTRETVEKINWDNFQRTDIFTIADFDFIHPAMTK